MPYKFSFGFKTHDTFLQILFILFNEPKKLSEYSVWIQKNRYALEIFTSASLSLFFAVVKKGSKIWMQFMQVFKFRH